MDDKENLPAKKFSVEVRKPAIDELIKSLPPIQAERQANDGSYETAQRILALKEQLVAAQAKIAADRRNSSKIELDEQDMKVIKTELTLGDEADFEEEGGRRGQRMLVEEIEASYRQAQTANQISGLFKKAKGFFKRS